MMVTPRIGLASRTILTQRRPSKLAGPDHQRLIEQSTLFEVGDQRGNRLIGHASIEREFSQDGLNVMREILSARFSRQRRQVSEAKYRGQERRARSHLAQPFQTKNGRPHNALLLT